MYITVFDCNKYCDIYLIYLYYSYMSDIGGNIKFESDWRERERGLSDIILMILSILQQIGIFAVRILIASAFT